MCTMCAQDIEGRGEQTCAADSEVWETCAYTAGRKQHNVYIVDSNRQTCEGPQSLQMHAWQAQHAKCAMT